MNLSQLATLAVTLTLALGAGLFELRSRRVPELLGGVGIGLALGAHALLGGLLDVLSGSLGVLVASFPYVGLRAAGATRRGHLLLAAAFGASLALPGAIVLTGLGGVLWLGLRAAPLFGLRRRNVAGALVEARIGLGLGLVATLQALSPLWLG